MAELNARIIPKASGTASEEPLAADLEVAELAVNTADGKLFTKHTDGSVVALGGEIDSVNGETGTVSLGIQDMDDFDLYEVQLNGTVTLSNKVTTLTGDGQFKEPVNSNPFIGNYLLFYNQGNDHTEISKLSAGDAVEFTFDDASTFTTTVDDQDINGGFEDYLSVVDQWPAKALTTTSIVISSSQFTSGGTADVPLADGDIIRWINADNVFRPAQIATVATSGDYNDLTNLPTLVTAIDDLSDVSVPSPVDGEVLTYSGTNGQWESVAAGSGGGAVRTTVSVATPSLANQAPANIDFVGIGKSGTFVTVETDVAAWVTFYTDSVSRANDSARSQVVSPSLGSGVLLEVITTGAQTIRITPAINYFNDDAVLVPNLVAKVVNISGATSVVNTTVDVVTLEP